jgi:hypothetical protein
MREEYLIRYRRGGSFLRPFIVAAPRPYVVDLSGFVDAEGARSGARWPRSALARSRLTVGVTA